MIGDKLRKLPSKLLPYLESFRSSLPESITRKLAFLGISKWNEILDTHNTDLGMNLSDAEKKLDDFFAHERKKVFALRGKWGTGKTYFWKNLYLPAKEKKDWRKKPYAYVSLFGVESLEQLEKSVFYAPLLAHKDLRILKAAKKQIGVAIAKLGWKAIPGFKDLDISSLKIEGILIKDYVICFDDIERMSDKFAMKDFLGFVARLKESLNVSFPFAGTC